MKLNCKEYKVQKFQNYFIKKNIYFFYTEFNSTSKIRFKQRQLFLDSNLVLLIVVNSVLKVFFKYSIFKNLALLVTGSIVLVSFNTYCNLNLVLKNLIKLNSDLLLLGIKLNKNIYSVNQFKKISSLNYKNNILILHKSLKNNILFSYFKFLNSKIESK